MTGLFDLITHIVPLVVGILTILVLVTGFLAAWKRKAITKWITKSVQNAAQEQLEERLIKTLKDTAGALQDDLDNMDRRFELLKEKHANDMTTARNEMSELIAARDDTIVTLTKQVQALEAKCLGHEQEIKELQDSLTKAREALAKYAERALEWEKFEASK